MGLISVEEQITLFNFIFTPFYVPRITGQIYDNQKAIN